MIYSDFHLPPQCTIVVYYWLRFVRPLREVDFGKMLDPLALPIELFSSIQVCVLHSWELSHL
jgi:hypothetical protein